jgi:hypothetical protein
MLYSVHLYTLAEFQTIQYTSSFIIHLFFCDTCNTWQSTDFNSLHAVKVMYDSFCDHKLEKKVRFLRRCSESTILMLL